MIKKYKILIVGLLITVLFNLETKLSAQDKAIEIEEMVITATRILQPSDEVAASVDVITASEIDKKKIITLADVMQSVPGLHMAQSGTKGQTTSLFIRGTESNHTQLQIDGRKISPNLAGGYDYTNLNLDNIKRIEVVKSPSSVTHGADAIGGVVNLISKDPTEEPTHNIEGEFGSYGAYRISGSSARKIDNLSYTASFTHEESDFQRPNNSYKQTGIRGKLDYESDQLHTDLLFGWYEVNAGVPGITSFPSPEDNIDTQSVIVSPGLEWKPSESWNHKIYLSYDQQIQDFFSPFFGNKQEMKTWRLDYSATYTGLESLILLAGTEAYTTEVLGEGFSPIDESQDNAGFFLHSQYQPNKQWNLLTAVRYDTFSDFKDAWSWRTGLSFQPRAGLDLHTSVSEAYAIPTFQDLYFPGSSNPDANPEKGLSWEGGVKLHSGAWKLSGIVFWNEIDDLIQFVPDPEIEFTGRVENVALARTYGLELSTAYEGKQLQTQLNYTYTEANDVANDKRLLRRPRHQFDAIATAQPTDFLYLNLGVTWILDREDLNPNTFIQGDHEDYLAVRASATISWNDFEFWVRGVNLLNDHYEPIAGFPATDVSLFTGVKYNF